MAKVKKGYNGYALDSSARSYMLQNYPPKYNKVIAHHITFKFGVYEELPPAADMARVVGYKNSGDGLEAFVVEINGSVKRPDGKLYHITYSLDPGKYSPKDSNTLLSTQGYNSVKPFIIKVKPSFFPMN